MGVRRRILAFLALGCFVSPPAARAQSEAGLLLGLSSGETLWITLSQDSEFHVAARKSRLLVPRDDGFWWVGTESRCVLEDLREGGVNVERGIWINREQAVFVSRAGETAHIDIEGDPCPDVERKVVRLRAGRAKLAGNTDSSSRVDELDCSTTKRAVTFVSPAALSIEMRGMLTEFCSPAKYYMWGANFVTDFTTEKKISLRSVLPDADWTKITEKFAAPDEDEFQEELTYSEADTSWIVTHDGDRWSAAFWRDGSIAERGGHDLDYTIPVPSQFTADAPLPLSFDSIKVRFPRAIEAFASPSGEYLLVREAGSAFLVLVEKAGMSDTVFEFPVALDDRFVMLQWASSERAAEWSAAIPPLKEPRVKQVRK